MDTRSAMNALRTLAISIAALTAGCSEFHAKNQEGGETHFLMECGEQACPSGLECVCGVCTKACIESEVCSALGEAATCLELAEASLVCEGAAPMARICDQDCDNDSDCSALGDDLECVDSRCRPQSIATQIATMGGDASVPDQSVDPLLFIVLDTSGSMERLTDCTCTTAACEECLPDCDAVRPEKNRWAQALEALTGSFNDFSCVAWDRSEGDRFTYDRSYTLPYHEPLGTQDGDGLLDMFADRVRFGIATFDGVSSYDRDTQRGLSEFDFGLSQSEPGLWSYPPSEGPVVRPDGTLRGHYRYPGGPHDYWMDTGIRSASATEGGVLAAINPATSASVAADIQSSLLRTRPYGGTPIAAALDDLYWYFANDPATEGERASLARKRHVVLITDGRPNDDYRASNCDCGEPDSGKDCSEFLLPSESAGDMSCPYPKPERATRNLRCGYSDFCDDGVVEDVYVIGFGVFDDPVAQRRVRDMALEGNTGALFAQDAVELRETLATIVEEITNEPEQSAAEGEDCVLSVGPSLIYEDGATWQRGCNRCECIDGKISCTRIECARCTNDDECGDAEVCHFGWETSCNFGKCGPASFEDCSGPISIETACTCDGETVTTLDCAVMAGGIAHSGACD